MSTLTRILSFFFKDFERIFFIREYTALAGRNQKVLITLAIILFFTFLALGFAYGSLANLEKKMNNPYTNWVDLPISEGDISKKAREIVTRYNTPEIASQLELKNTNGFSKYVIEFYKNGFMPYHAHSDSPSKTLWGRTIEADEPLLTEILDPDPEKGNLVWAAEDFDPENFDACDIIVTQQMLEQLGYDDPASVGHLLINDTGQFIFLHLAAVVNELPSFCRFISSPRLYNILMAQTDETNAYEKAKAKACQSLVAGNREGDNNFAILTDHPNALPALDSLARVFFSGKDARVDAGRTLLTGATTHQACNMSFDPSNAPSLDSVNAFIEWARPQAPIAAYAYIECTPSECGNLDSKAYHYLAFHFERLDAIRAFGVDLKDEFSIEIDLSQIESKENFALVSRLTYIICLILMVFAASNIVFFVNNLLRTHLFEVRSNLGTFQAFGLSNHFLVRIYLKIIFTFLTISALAAFLLSIIVDRFEQVWQGSDSKFDIFNNWILMSVIGLYIVSLLLSARTIRAISGDTPGNLIYER